MLLQTTQPVTKPAVDVYAKKLGQLQAAILP
jgi:hypothetical protein